MRVICHAQRGNLQQILLQGVEPIILRKSFSGVQLIPMGKSYFDGAMILNTFIAMTLVKIKKGLKKGKGSAACIIER